MLILYNVRMDMAGGVDFSAANAKSNAQLRVKCETTFQSLFFSLFICQSCSFCSGFWGSESSDSLIFPLFSTITVDPHSDKTFYQVSGSVRSLYSDYKIQ